VNKRSLRLVIYSFFAANLILGLYYLNEHYEEYGYLSEKLSATDYFIGNTDKDKISIITSWIYSNSKMKNNELQCPAWKMSCWEHTHPLWNVLKAPPRVIVDIGGHCGNLTRLSVNMFELAGFNAKRWHLWFTSDSIDKWEAETGKKAENQYGHAVVEVQLADRKIVVDPVFNIVYPYSLHELSHDTNLIWKFVPDDYEWIYTYEEPRGIRWNILGNIGDKFYDYLVGVFGRQAVNNLTYPYLMDRPYLFICFVHFVASFLLIVCLYLLRLDNVRNTRNSQ